MSRVLKADGADQLLHITVVPLGDSPAEGAYPASETTAAATSTCTVKINRS